MVPRPMSAATTASAKHLQGYLNEYVWRYNHRHDALFGHQVDHTNESFRLHLLR